MVTVDLEEGNVIPAESESLEGVLGKLSPKMEVENEEPFVATSVEDVTPTEDEEMTDPSETRVKIYEMTTVEEVVNWEERGMGHVSIIYIQVGLGCFIDFQEAYSRV